MRKNLLTIIAILCMGIPSFATIHTVTVSDFAFTPATVSMNIGDTIKWVWSSGTHTTTSTSVPTGAATWDQPMTSSSTTFMYKPTVAGTYAYKCTFHASMGMVGTFTVAAGTNVSAFQPAQVVTIFPNPASSALHLQFQDNANTTVTLFDIFGKSVLSMQSVMTQGQIDISEIPNGMYNIIIKHGSAEYNQKLVIAH